MTKPDDLTMTQRSRRRHGAWMQTFTGRRFYPLDPRAAEIDIRDVAHGLAMTCRYGGHSRRFYSVAEHAWLVSHYLPGRWKLEGLLHDSAEAYVGDMVRPLKHEPEMLAFRVAEERIEVEVAKRFGLRWGPKSRAAVKTIDNRILVNEIRALMPRPELYMTGPLGSIDPLPARGFHVEYRGAPDLRPICWDPAEAERRFLERFEELRR